MASLPPLPSRPAQERHDRPRTTSQGRSPLSRERNNSGAYLPPSRVAAGEQARSHDHKATAGLHSPLPSSAAELQHGCNPTGRAACELARVVCASNVCQGRRRARPRRQLPGRQSRSSSLPRPSCSTVAARSPVTGNRQLCRPPLCQDESSPVGSLAPLEHGSWVAPAPVPAEQEQAKRIVG
jgi:hypothetical protein